MTVRWLLCAALGVALSVSACGDSPTGTGDEYDPDIDPADFSTRIGNPFLPLTPGTTFVYDGMSGGEVEHGEVTVTSDTRTIMGVSCVVVRDQVFVDGELAEDTWDWFAEDSDGNVWYFGEDSREIENGVVVGTEGSWEAGVDGARPGIVMPATPILDVVYRQEYYEGEAEDMAKVVALDAIVAVPAGNFTGCLKTEEWTPLEPGAREYKFYARGIGLVKEQPVGGGASGMTLSAIRTE